MTLRRDACQIVYAFFEPKRDAVDALRSVTHRPKIGPFVSVDQAFDAVLEEVLLDHGDRYIKEGLIRVKPTVRARVVGQDDQSYQVKLTAPSEIAEHLFQRFAERLVACGFKTRAEAPYLLK